MPRRLHRSESGPAIVITPDPDLDVVQANRGSLHGWKEATGHACDTPAMSDRRSPWPDDPPAERPDAGTDQWDAELDRPAGSRGVGITVALASFGFGVALPALVVVGVYSMLMVYAIVKVVGSAPDQPNGVAIALGIVGMVSLFVVVLGAAISLVGRAADPKRRR